MFLEMVKLLNLLVNKHRWTKGGGGKGGIYFRTGMLTLMS